MLSEGSGVKGSPEDKQPLCQDFTAGHSGTLYRCRVGRGEGGDGGGGDRGCGFQDRGNL